MPQTISIQRPTNTRCARLSPAWLEQYANCAEFCAQDHLYSIGDEGHEQEICDDCSETETDGATKEWEYSRAGWCPGARVWPWDMDITEAVGEATEMIFLSFEWLDLVGHGDQPYYYMSGNIVTWRE